MILDRSGSLVYPAERMAGSYRPYAPDPDNTGEGRELPKTEVSRKNVVSQFPTEDIFSKILSDAIKEGMQFLGDSPLQAVVIYIEKKHSIKEHEYSKRLETFHRALTEIFGIGTMIIERRIAKNLCGRLGIDFREQENWTIVEYVEEAKRRTRSHA